jgi:hypothetical protein
MEYITIRTQVDNINDKINALNARLETIRNAENEYFWQMASKYGTRNWMYDRSVQADREDIRRFYDMKAKGDALQAELGKLIDIALRADEEEEERKRQETATEYEQSKALFACAANEYGTTEDPQEAGYILPDGSMLDFSGGEGIRGTDHRNITSAFIDAGIQLPDNWSRTDAMCDFIRRGAIRYMPECNGFDMCQEPTQEQYSTIKQIIRQMGGTTDVDFDGNDGNTLLSVHYDDVTPQRLEADIYRYFNEGIKPQGDAWESRRKRRLAEGKEDRPLGTRDLLRDLERAKTRAETRLVTFNWQMCQKYGTKDWLNEYGFDHENNRPTEDARRLLALNVRAGRAEYEFEDFKRTLGIKENRKHDMNKKIKQTNMKQIIRLTENDVRQMVKQTAMRILRESEDDYASDPLRDLKSAKAKAQARLKTFNWQMCQKYGTNDWLDKYGYDHENNRPTQDAIRLLGLHAQNRKAEQELEEFQREDIDETIRMATKRNMNEAIRRAAKRAINEVVVDSPDGEIRVHGSWNDAPGIDRENGRRDATEDEKLNAFESWAFMKGLRQGREDNFEDMDGMSMNLSDKDRFNVDREINTMASKRDLDNANDFYDDLVGDEPEEPEYENVPDEDHPMEKRRKMMRNDKKRQEYRNAIGDYSQKSDMADKAGRDYSAYGRLTGKSMFGSMKDKYGAF